MQTERVDPWTTYWSRGFLHSCPNAFAANYDNAIGQFWTEYFGALAESASVLDIGTGNGAVALLARDAGRQRGRNYRVTGIDRAKINPVAMSSAKGLDYAGIEFLGEVSIEETGLAPASFNAISSQYVLEYTDIERALREIVRLLAPEGRLGCVLHHADSIVAATSRVEAGHLDFLLEDAQIFARGEDLLRAIQHAIAPEQVAALRSDPHAEQCRAQFNAAAARVSERIRSSRHVDLLQLALGQVAHAIKERGSLGARAFDALQAAREEMTASRRRLSDLLAASLTPQGMLELRVRIEEAGLTLVSTGELRHTDGTLLGWSLVAVKRTEEPV